MESPGGRDAVVASPAAVGRPGTDADLLLLGGGAGVAVAGRLWGRSLDLVAQVVVARGLGPAGFGLYALIVVAVRAVALLAQVGLQQGTVRFAASEWTARPAAARAVVRLALFVALGAAGLAGACLFALAPWLAARVFDEPSLAASLRLAAAGVPVVTLAAVAAAATRASRRTGYATAAEDVLQPVLHLALLAVLWVIGLTVWGATAAFLASFAASLLLSLGFLARLLPRPAARETGPGAVSLRRLLGTSLPVALAGVCSLYVYWVDRLFLGALRPAAEVGAYQVAVQLTAPLAIVLGGFSVILAPLAAAAHAGDDRRRLGELWRVATRWGLCLAVPGVLVLAAAGRDLVALLFGADFAPPTAALGILVAAQLVSVACGPVGALLVMTGRERSWLAITLGGLAGSVALNTWLVPVLGPPGAALATGVAVAGMAVAGAVVAGRDVSGGPHDRRLGKLLVAVAAAGLLLALLPAGGTPWVRMAAVTAVATAGFWGVLALAGLEPEDRLLLRRLGVLARTGGGR